MSQRMKVLLAAIAVAVAMMACGGGGGGDLRKVLEAEDTTTAVQDYADAKLAE